MDTIMKRPTQAVILCGGLGTRLKPYTNHTPKPMVSCNGKPFLWYLLNQLWEEGISNFLLLTGYRAGQIQEYFENGTKWSWNIEYSQGPQKWDTGKRVWEAQEKLDKAFILLYSDNFAPFPLDKVLSFHEIGKLPLTLMVSPKSPGNIILNESGIVEKYDNTGSIELGLVEIGYMFVEKEKTLKYFETPECSFSSVLRKMAEHQQVRGYLQYDAYHSISDPERWKKTEEYLKPKKILLIDRDGVINRKAKRGEYVSRWEDFYWISDTFEAMKQLAQDGYQFIVISNQAGIARGMIEPNELEQIHRKMIKKFQDDGIIIRDIFICPHHWEEECFCRKPKPGLLHQASKKYLFRLDKTLFIGDDTRDCQAAERAGCASMFIGNSSELKSLTKYEQPVKSSTSLLNLLDAITQHFTAPINVNTS
jgi:histidinol-phosphate phosphatase family protein